ncbi:hypothetical protein GCM10028801_38820 [Nocardioides maradonensis]
MTDGLPLLVDHLRGYYALTTLAMGRRSGALAVLLEGPRTSADLAARAGLDARSADLWLRAMAAAGHAHHDAGTFTVDGQTASILGPDFPVDFGAVLDVVHAGFSPPLQEATTAMATGAGVPSAAYAELAAAASPANTPTYRMALVQEWIGAAPELVARLADGGRIADIACGGGDAAALMAAAFPRAEVVGFDPATPEGVHEDVPNLRLVRDEAARLPADGSFDLVTCLDAFHHLPAAGVAGQVHAALREGGVFLLAETALTGDVDEDGADPFSLVAHAAALMYCLPENLANGGTGETPSVGLGWLERALADAGFAEVTSFVSETGYRIFHAVR